MSEHVLQGGQHHFTVCSNDEPQAELVIDCRPDTVNEAVIEITGRQPLQLKITDTIGNDAALTILTINHCEGKVDWAESHTLNRNSKAVIAYAQLQDGDLTFADDFALNGPGAELTVKGASLTAGRKQMHLRCVHNAGQTTAHIDNYGIVMAKGRCEIVVENTIKKGCHKASTHQSSRLLSYDKTAYGRILPILYIDDDDVAASHAASLGQPDENQLYYMESRGLTRQQALNLLTIGYLMPVTQAISDDKVNKTLKQEIETKVAKQCLK